MNGFLNILKPPGMSSGAVVARIKHLTGEKTGHAGTLDPEASGVLPVMIGRAARLLDHLPDENKTYIGEIAFAGATDTQDAQGSLITPAAGVPTREALEKVLSRFCGPISQVPPDYSAIKRGGVPLYKLARQGAAITVEARQVTIHGITILDKPSQDSFLLRVDCSRGTYIRTLFHDIGAALGMPAHMRFLLRTLSAGFCIEDSITLEELTDIAAVKAHLIPPDQPLSYLAAYTVPFSLKKQAINGVALPAPEDILPGQLVRIYLQDVFIGIAVREEDVLRFRVINSDHTELSQRFDEGTTD